MGCKVGDEVGEVVWGRRGEDLLDLFGAGELQEDGGAFGGGTAFEVVACGPGGGGGVFGWGVEGAEVDGGDFVGGGGGRGWSIDEGSAWVGGGWWDGGFCEDFGACQAEGGYAVVSVKVCGQSMLIEDVAFVILDEEEDT